ncbi:DUF262 domain-containing HNH endonuclease family protein [Priestia filamentosa]|uniref:DUF262 domain-containing protein n=1 Tax=Priestia filamentosa TaxID=1402861 RepID=UPI00398234F4
MNFTYRDMPIRNLLGHNNTKLNIPRFQRDYSWEKKEIGEFIEDLLLSFGLEDSTINTGEYFFGTILLAGDLSKSGSDLEVVDGQQRITTATILLSALASSFKLIDKDDLANLVWSYILKSDDDGEKFRVLKNYTANNYFEYVIQSDPAEDIPPVDEETERIAFAKSFFLDYLKEENLKRNLCRLHNDQGFQNIEYSELLKALRNQLLNSLIICIVTKDRNSANHIFEILNAKGKQLEPIDLIKNTIFKYLNSVEPTDDANNKWNKIKSKLIDRNERVEFSTFYRHYWLSKYRKVKDSELYDEFINKIDVENYKEFLNDLVLSSEIYKQITSPLTTDYQNKQQFLYIPQSFDYLNKYFNIKQCRVALLSLIRARYDKRIKNSQLKKILSFLHSFHFAYSALCKKRANALEAKYSKFAINISNSKNANDIGKHIDEFISDLKSILPSYSEFEDGFIKLEFSKSNNPKNMVTKYALYNLERYYAQSEHLQVNISIEHIIPETSANPETINIGNLVLLEKKINEDLGNHTFIDKCEGYTTSSYFHIKDLLEKYNVKHPFTDENILERAKELANIYYNKILLK